MERPRALLPMYRPTSTLVYTRVSARGLRKTGFGQNRLRSQVARTKPRGHAHPLTRGRFGLRANGSAAPRNSPPYARSEVAEGRRGGSFFVRLRVLSCDFVVRKNQTTRSHEPTRNQSHPMIGRGLLAGGVGYTRNRPGCGWDAWVTRIRRRRSRSGLSRCRFGPKSGHFLPPQSARQNPKSAFRGCQKRVLSKPFPRD